MPALRTAALASAAAFALAGATAAQVPFPPDSNPSFQGLGQLTAPQAYIAFGNSDGIASDGGRPGMIPLSVNKPPCLAAQKTAGAPAPQVVKTLPAAGATVRPGQMVLSVTFDQPMACFDTLQAGSPFPIPCPGANTSVLISLDRRTFTTVCQVQGQADYSMPISGFISDRGAPSRPYALDFETSNAPPIKDARKAMKEELARR